MTDAAPFQAPFRAEVSRLLHIVTHALYSEKEIFLRELISNASDACDRLRYAAVTAPDLLGGEGAFAIGVTPDPEARTLTVHDNGIGMTRAELIENLGTIAKSGTEAFFAGLTGDAKKDLSLIGQFGVGFYSAFMVAEKVVVISRRAGEADSWSWTSDGGGFTVAPADRAARGTTVTLHLRADAGEFLDPARLKRIVKAYSDHIAFPIRLGGGAAGETVNAASALWARPKSEITPEQYREFYRHVAHATDEPWATIHAQAEGKLDYALLLFVPGRPPFDLFDPSRKPRVKLFVRRVFIAEAGEELVPPWLRFLRGIVDSADLPLNVSRELLQQSPVLARLRQTIVRRVLAELERKAESAPDDYATFWGHFGAVLKEGLYEDPDPRPRLLKLARFHSTAGDKLVSLAEYVGRMAAGQDAIYTISGADAAALAQSPQLEGFRAKGVEVLLLTDAVDDFWISSVGEFAGKPFRSATRGGADLAAIAAKADAPAAEKAPGPALATLVAIIKQTLGAQVKDVRESDRLTGSAVCLVAAEGDLDLHLERLMRAHGKVKEASPRILEINPGHALIRKLAERATQPGAAEALADTAHLLLDQARVLEGEALPDPPAFARRLAALLARAAE
jgi:molecular chaperone HtpG